MTPGDVSLLRFAFFAGIFVLLALVELRWPLQPKPERGLRWPTNLGLSVMNTLVLRALAMALPVAALASAAAMFPESGVLRAVGLEGPLLQVAGFVLLDAAVYAQHRLFHAVPAFWRFHQVHHADLTLDVSSAIRFHTVEIVLSQAWKVLVVAAAGVPVEAALAFEIVLNASSMFTHANVALPSRIDGLVRLVLVTPGMHRIHHSMLGTEMNSNYGFNFSVWDRVFGSYVARAAAPVATMELGLPGHRDRSTAKFSWLLQLPFGKGSSP